MIKVKNFIKTTNPDEVRVNCPQCEDLNHHMYVNLRKQVFHCFKCQSSGRLTVTHGDDRILDEYQERVELFLKGKSSEEELPEKYELRVPPEYRSLGAMMTPAAEFFFRRAATRYLSSRGIEAKDILKYHMGYCYKGYYAGRIIIPCFFEGQLEYFITRAYTPGREPRYLNPKVSKMATMFYSESRPTDFIVLCEGVLDAIKIARVCPAVALLGKELTKHQLARIASHAKGVAIMLDPEAWKESILMMTQILTRSKLWVRSIQIPTEDRDPGDMGYREINKLLTKQLKEGKNEDLYELFRSSKRDRKRPSRDGSRQSSRDYAR